MILQKSLICTATRDELEVQGDTYMNKFQWAVLVGIMFIIIGIVVFISSIGSLISNPSGGIDISGAVVIFLGLIIVGITEARHSVR
jgi:hypothetical protein